MAWTTSEDVLGRWVGENRPTDDSVIDTLIADAERLVTLRYSDVQARIDAGTLDRGDVVMVVSRVVERKLRNPEGVRSSNQQTGPYGAGKTFAADKPGELYLSDDDIVQLGYTPGAGRPQAFTINTAVNAGTRGDGA